MSRADMLQAIVLALGDINAEEPPDQQILLFQEEIVVAAARAWDAGYHWSLAVFATAVRPMVQDVAHHFYEENGSLINPRYVKKVTGAIQLGFLAGECENAPGRSESDAHSSAPQIPASAPAPDPAPRAVPASTGGGPSPGPAQDQPHKSPHQRPAVAALPEGSPNCRPGFDVNPNRAKRRRIRTTLEPNAPRPYPCPYNGCYWKGAKRRSDIADHVHRVHGIETPYDRMIPAKIMRLRTSVLIQKLVVERKPYRARRGKLISIADAIKKAEPDWICPEEVNFLRREAKLDKNKSINNLNRSQAQEELIYIRTSNRVSDAAGAMAAENQRVGIVSEGLEKWFSESSPNVGATVISPGGEGGRPLSDQQPSFSLGTAKSPFRVEADSDYNDDDSDNDDEEEDEDEEENYA